MFTRRQIFYFFIAKNVIVFIIPFRFIRILLLFCILNFTIFVIFRLIFHITREKINVVVFFLLFYVSFLLSNRLRDRSAAQLRCSQQLF